LLSQLSDRGYDKDRLNDIRNLVDASDSDLFDVLSYVLFSADLQTRQNRADRVTDDGLDTDNEEMRDLLVGILRSYVENGEPELQTNKPGQFLTAR